MAEYKDVEQIKKRVREECDGCWNRNSPSKCPDDCGAIEAIRAMDSVPPVDAVTVRHGWWRHYEGMLTCSECGMGFYDDIMEYCGDHVPKFCPDCGARMDGKDGGNGSTD